MVLGGALNRRLVAAGLASLFVLAMTALGPEKASAGVIACGATITTDTTLTADLVDCPSNGIVIGADNVTLDLNGHTVDGDAEFTDPCPKTEFCDIGVVSEGHDGLTIKGGRFKQFFVGVSVIAAKRAHLRELATTRNILGAGVFDSRRAHLRRLTASHNVDSGFILVNTARSALSRSSANANGLDTDQAGMGLFESHDVKIKRTSLSRNGDIGLFAPGNDNLQLVKNKVTGNPEVGILMDGDSNLIARNRFARNGDGFALGGNDNVIRRNRVIRSNACPEGCGVGIQVEAGKRNVIVGNTIRHTDAAGLRIAGYGPIAGAVAARNRISDAGKDGIAVVSPFEPVTDVELRANRAVGSGDDGIDVNVKSVTITRNVARRNREHGINAVDGATDGGGNRASGNGNTQQCKNVVCA